MKAGRVLVLFTFILAIASTNSTIAQANSEDSRYRIGKLLANPDVLSATSSSSDLFSLSDEDLELVWDFWQSSNVVESRNSQYLARLLGNTKVLQRLQAFCMTRSCYISGAVPSTMLEIEQRMVIAEAESGAICKWNQWEMNHVFPILIDRAGASRKLYQILIDRSSKCSKSSLVRLTIDLATRRGIDSIILDQEDLEASILKNAFFLSDQAEMNVAAKLVGFNASRSKALLVVHVDGSALAERWYHVVAAKDHAGTWRFFSVGLVSVS
jgi:hypothetical protein